MAPAQSDEQDLRGSAITRNKNISCAEHALDRWKQLLRAVNRVAAALLSVTDEEKFEASLREGLEIVARCVDADRINIWRNEMRDGVLYYAQEYEWMNEIGRRNNPVNTVKAFPYRQQNSPEWEGRFRKGQCVNGSLADLSQGEQNMLGPYGIKSILVLPMHLEEEFWGFVSFDDCHQERSFTEEEIDLLRSASLMMVSAVNRNAQAAKLHEAHMRTKLMLDATPLACSLWDRDIRSFDCNEETVKLFRLKEKKDFLNGFFDFSPEYQPDGQLSKEKAYAYARKAFEDGRCVFEWMHQLSDGILLPTEITLVRVCYGTEYIVAAYVRDMRRYKRMLREVESALKKAQEANHAKSFFLARMSHEMRTPLNAIIGLSELTLEPGVPGEEILSNVEKVHNAGMTLLGTVNDILDISKIEAGKLELAPCEYDVPSLINDAVNQSLSYIDEKPIEFVLEIDENLPARLYGDDLKIKQILNNLLTNAIKYTRDGKVQLSLRCEREDDDVWVAIRVIDTGIGIKPEELKHLFGDYTQMNVEINREIRGTGLGLAITKRIAELMDGSIAVESEYGKGSIFTVKIRQKFVSDEVIGQDTATKLKSFNYSYSTRFRRGALQQSVRIRLPYARVLLVDDISVNLNVAKGMMKPYGMQIDCVTGGRQAVDAIRDETVRYDAIFMDHMMPGMDGITATKIIREEIGTEYAQNIPIIALTANAILGNKQMFLRSGFQDYLCKPIEIARLDAVIRKWISDEKKEESFAGRQNEDLRVLPDALGCGNGNTVFDRRSGTDRRRASDKKAAWLDVRKGVERLGGDSGAYMQILRTFTTTTRSLLDVVREATEDKLTDYAITVHGIKGSSRGICAEVVGNMAETMEKSAKSGNFNFVRTHNPNFIKTVEALIGQIDGMLDNMNAENRKPRKDMPDIKTLSELADACKNYDMDGVDAAMAEIENFEYESGGELAAWLRTNIDQMNFKQIEEKISGFGTVNPDISSGLTVPW